MDEDWDASAMHHSPPDPQEENGYSETHRNNQDESSVIRRSTRGIGTHAFEEKQSGTSYDIPQKAEDDTCGCLWQKMPGLRHGNAAQTESQGTRYPEVPYHMDSN